jgi:low affinity Fe/Cu permease
MTIHIQIERYFEKVADFATVILGNSITFILALGMVVFWFSNRLFYTQDIHDSIGDVILGITFLSLFIIQKTFNRFSGALHLKINELVVSNKAANNLIINVETKTEHEITELAKEYTELAEQAKERAS